MGLGRNLVGWPNASALVGALALATVSEPAVAAVRCGGPSSNQVEVQREQVAAKAKELEVVSTSTHGDGMFGFAAAQLAIYGPDCRILFQKSFGVSTEVRFETRRLGTVPVLVVTALQPGGSGDNFEHLVLAYDDGIRPLAPMDLQHSNMGGFFIGELGRGRGPGLVLWDAIWEDGAHYSPHRYRVTTYRWRAESVANSRWRPGAFLGPSEVMTKQRLDPDPDAVARALGLGFRDLTKPRRFRYSDAARCENNQPDPSLCQPPR